MTLRVWTARLGAYDGPDKLDITRGSGHGVGLLFAPSTPLFASFKRAQRFPRGVDSLRREFAVYAGKYRAELCTTADRVPDLFAMLLVRDEVTLCCYCAAPTLCHRGVLAAMLGERGAVCEGER